MDQNGDMIRRIIALLFALARLAESAVSLPRPLRYFALNILRRGEIAGRSVVAKEACYLRAAPWVPDQAAVHQGNEPFDAMNLAQCFRLLAIALAGFAALVLRGAFAWRRPPVRPARQVAARILDLCAFEPVVIDSS